VGSSGGSDHNPIFFQLELRDENPSSPFKFNPIWLEEEYFQELVRSEWKHFDGGIRVFVGRKFAVELKVVKVKVVDWVDERYKKRDHVLKETEHAIADLFNSNVSGIFDGVEKQTLKDLELKMKNLLRD
jgi:hypothetical protein